MAIWKNIITDTFYLKVDSKVKGQFQTDRSALYNFDNIP